MPRQTIMQLGSRNFPTREKLVQELKRNGFPESGEDYHIACDLGQWHIADGPAPDLPAAAADDAPVDPPPVTVLPERPARGVKKSAQKKASDDASKKAAKAAAANSAPAMKAKPKSKGGNGGNGNGNGGNGNGAGKPPEPAAAPPAPPEAAAPDGDDLSLLPPAAYTVQFPVPEAQQASAVAWAAGIAQQAGCVVRIFAPDGAEVRFLDPKVIWPHAKKGGGSRSRAPVASRSRAPAGVSFSRPATDAIAEQCIALARRPHGATRVELSALNGNVVINWKNWFATIARRQKLVLHTDRSGPTPVYSLKPA